MGRVGKTPADGIDEMLETGRGVVRILEGMPSSVATREALAKMKLARTRLTEARAAVERIRGVE